MDAGFTLVELCVTIAILGLAVAALVGTIASASTLSDKAATTTESEAYGRRIAEIVRQPSFPTYICGTLLTQQYTDKVTTELGANTSSDLAFRVTDVRWTTDVNTMGASPKGDALHPDGWYSASCAGGTVQANILVMLWVEISVWPNNDPNYITKVSVLKRGTT